MTSTLVIPLNNSNVSLPRSRISARLEFPFSFVWWIELKTTHEKGQYSGKRNAQIQFNEHIHNMWCKRKGKLLFVTKAIDADLMQDSCWFEVDFNQLRFHVGLVLVSCWIHVDFIWRWFRVKLMSCRQLTISFCFRSWVERMSCHYHSHVQRNDCQRKEETAWLMLDTCWIHKKLFCVRVGFMLDS